jgi:hypothetical protein
MIRPGRSANICPSVTKVRPTFILVEFVDRGKNDGTWANLEASTIIAGVKGEPERPTVVEDVNCGVGQWVLLYCLRKIRQTRDFEC